MTRGIRLGARHINVKFTVNSVCLLEDAFGKPFYEVVAGGVRGLRALLWCGLLHDSPTLPMDEVGAMLDEGLQAGASLSDVLNDLTGALEDAGFFRSAESDATRAGFADSGSNCSPAPPSAVCPTPTGCLT